MGGSNSKKPAEPEEEDSSDFIDIEQENGSDELNITAEEDNYPPAPSEVPVQNGFITHRAKAPMRSRKSSIDSTATSRSVKSTKPIKTSRKQPDVNYSSAIASAMLNIAHKAETYETLLKDLIGSLETDKEKVYAITLWLSQQDIETGKFSKFKPDTPRGYMNLIQNKRGTFSAFFAQLCRKSGMPCVIVAGYSKSASYDVGEMDDEILKEYRNAWNVVFADNAWYIVHPFWVCRGLVGHKLGGYVKIEKGGQAVMQKETASAGQLTKCFNKYYIFTDPNEFVSSNIPIDEQARWQLLQTPLTFEEYKHKPYVRNEFYKQNLKLKSKEDCLLFADNGICSIDFEIPHKTASLVNFTYELDMKVEEPNVYKQDTQTSLKDNIGVQNQTGSNGNINNLSQGNNQTGEDDDNKSRTLSQQQLEDLNNNIKQNIARYVIMMRSGQHQEHISFEVRLPKEGVYKISIYAGREDDWGDDPPLVASFRIVCNNLSADIVPEMAPIDPGIVGWGPGPKTFKSGLMMPSHEKGKIEGYVKEDILIQFQVVSKLQVSVTMVHNVMSSEELKQYYSYEEVYSEHTERRELNIKANVPNKDEYAIRIGTCENKNKQSPDYVCNYLIAAQELPRSRKLEGPLVKETRRQIQTALSSDSLEEVDNVLQRADKFHLNAESEESVSRLQKRREFLEIKKMFHDTYLRANSFACEQALVKVEESPYARLFKDDVARVHRMLERLDSNKRWPHPIPEKNRRTLMEISHLHAPPEQAQEVMKAICLLVFNFDDDEMDWGDTQAYLKNKERILKQMAKMENDESKMPSRKTMMKVKRLMDRLSEENVRKVDNSLTPFYLWVKNILEKYEDIESRRLESKRTSVVPSIQIPE